MISDLKFLAAIIILPAMLTCVLIKNGNKANFKDWTVCEPLFPFFPPIIIHMLRESASANSLQTALTCFANSRLGTIITAPISFSSQTCNKTCYMQNGITRNIQKSLWSYNLEIT